MSRIFDFINSSPLMTETLKVYPDLARIAIQFAKKTFRVSGAFKNLDLTQFDVLDRDTRRIEIRFGQFAVRLNCFEFFPLLQ